MDEATFADAVISNFEVGSDVRLKKFLLQAHNVAASSQSEPDAAGAYLDRVTILGAKAVLFGRADLFGRDDEFTATIDTLYKVYLQFQVRDGKSGDRASKLLDIITRVYALGSLTVRCGRWNLVKHVVHQPVGSSAGSAYVFSSWVRHGQVEASRANLFPSNQGGMLISAARALVADHPAMRRTYPMTPYHLSRTSAAQTRYSTRCASSTLPTASR